ncbi:MAG: L-threonylcarbamoyladenylate synthase, partial [Bacteroidota bacterium]|nr:L-threonylcarbamoyladenylate synthase [Bacteroidota bacterium]
MISTSELDIAAKYIKEGKLVAFPTETVYGLGANALNPLAVAKIFELKERPSFDPLIVHIASIDDLYTLTENTDRNVIRLAEKFWPGPLTIVLPKSKLVPDIVTSGLNTVGIRMPDNDIALMLIRAANCPIAAPSANKFGQLSPVSAEHVKKQLPNVDYVLDGGNTSVGIESTIVSIEGNTCTLLRPGVITIADIENALPDTFIYNSEKPEKLIAPGLLKSHYSPVKP